MQELYNCKQIDAEHFRITKFDKYLDPKYSPKGDQSSYVVSEHGCDCPQGNKPSCRHRKMLPFFIEHDYVDTEYFFVWETHQWYRGPTIAREARKENGRTEPAQALNVTELVETMQAVGIPTAVITEGGSTLNEAPSPQPSRVYRRF